MTTQIIVIVVIMLGVAVFLIGGFFLLKSFFAPADDFQQQLDQSGQKFGNQPEPKPPVKPEKSQMPWGDRYRGDQDQNRQEVCAEMSGNLFQHPCGQYARFVCLRCGKPICVQHLQRTIKGEDNCLSCAKLDPSDKPDQSWRESAWWHDTDIYIGDDDRPMWYSRNKSQQRQMRDLERNRSDDFTDGDEADLMEDGDGFETSGWENDLGAS